MAASAVISGSGVVFPSAGRVRSRAPWAREFTFSAAWGNSRPAKIPISCPKAVRFSPVFSNFWETVCTEFPRKVFTRSWA